MTFATLATIHQLLEDEVHRKESALEFARKNRNEKEDAYDQLLEDAAQEQINEASRILRDAHTSYEHMRDGYYAAKSALEDFEATNFR